MTAKTSLFQKYPGNTPDYIANALRNAILQGRYKANQPLRQDHIAEELGVSKIPLREALVQLKAEGLVKFLPQRGAVVSELSAAEVVEIYAMRIALESVAVEKAIPQLNNADFIRSQSVLEIIDSEQDKSQWGDLNWEFHATIYQAAQMPLLLNTIQSLHNNVVRYLIIYLDRLSASDQSQKEHWALLEACRNKKTADAVKILKGHLQQASDRLAAYLI
jgi:DNA-binding GntR family transcriptional regulator